MLDSIYIGITGLESYSKGLATIGNNVANLNTVGFKGSDLEFFDIQSQSADIGAGDRQSVFETSGSGVKVGGTSLRFTPGQFSQTGNDLDVAINGNGLFILRQDGKTFYTRAGQFAVDDSGYLTSRDDGARVAGLSGDALADISVAGKRSNPAKTTTEVLFRDSLSVGDTSFDVNDIAVYDSLGAKHQMKLHLVNDGTATPGRWTFTLSEGATTVTSGEVRYTGAGSPLAGYEKTTFSFAPGNGATATDVSLDFTQSNAFSSAGSSLSVASQNGHAAGFLTKTAIDADGKLVLTYSNGETTKDQRLALAWFDNLTALQRDGDRRFIVAEPTGRVLGSPGDTAFGKLQTASVELSNVDLAKEFSELIIVQRGYQASSQVITAANEMIQQLGEIRSGR